MNFIIDVDKFIIVESNYTHSGDHKEYNFDIKNLKNLKIKSYILRLKISLMNIWK